jgi:hypothetical protein
MQFVRPSICAGVLVRWERTDLKETQRGSPRLLARPIATEQVPSTLTPTQRRGLDLVGHARGATPPSPLSELAAATKDDIHSCKTQGLCGSRPVRRPFQCNPILACGGCLCGKWTHASWLRVYLPHSQSFRLAMFLICVRV